MTFDEVGAPARLSGGDPGPYTRAVRASFHGAIRARYPLFCACANLKPMNILKLCCCVGELLSVTFYV